MLKILNFAVSTFKTIFLVFFIITTFVTSSQALPTSRATLTSASGISSMRQMRVMDDGTIYIMGVDTTDMGSISPDGSTFTSITYDIALPSFSAFDFVASGSTIYIATNGSNPRIVKMSISGSSANTVTSVIPSGTGTVSMSLPSSSQFYIARSTNFKDYSTTDLAEGSSTTLQGATARHEATSSGVIYYYSTSGTLYYSPNHESSSDVSVLSSLGSSTTNYVTMSIKPDGTSLYICKTLISDGSTTIKKYSLSGATATQLWSYTTSNILAMDVRDSNGYIYLLNTSGVVTVLDPINAVTAFTANASGSSIDLAWTAGVPDSDFSGVTIRRSTTAYPVTPTDGVAVVSDSVASSYTDTGLSENTTYYYTIFNKTIDGYYSTILTATATTGIAPDAPTSFSGGVNVDDVNLSWTNPVDNFDSVMLRRSTTANPATPSDGELVFENSTETSYNDADLADGTYYYSLFATDGAGLYSEPTSLSFSIDATAPEAPSLLATVMTVNSINLMWNVPATTDHFVIRRSTESYPATGADGDNVLTTVDSATTETTDSGLSDGTYYYSIFAYDALYNESVAGQATATIDTIATEAPSSLAGSVNDNDIDLSWVNPSDSDFSHVMLRRSSTDFPSSTTEGSLVFTNNTGTSYSDADLSDGTYFYSLFAFDSYGNASEPAQRTFIIDTEAPSPITDVIASVDGSNVSLSWTNPIDADFSHTMIRSSDESTPDAPTTTSEGTLVATNVTGTSYNAESLPDGNYNYSFFTLDNSGNASSAVSVSFTIDATPPASPLELSAELVDNDVTLTWVNPEDEDFSYIAIVRNTLDFASTPEEGTLLGETTEETFTDEGLEVGDYYYSVFAYDDAGLYSDPAFVLIDYIGVTPTVSTLEVTTVTESEADLAGIILNTGTSYATTVGFEFGLTSSYEDVINENGTFTAEAFALTLEDLTCGTTYHYRAYATNETGTAYGSDETFETAPCPEALPSLTAGFSAVSDDLVVNESALITLSIENTSTSDASDTTVALNLTDAISFDSATALDAEGVEETLICTTDNFVTTCSLGLLPASESRSLTLTLLPVTAGTTQVSSVATSGEVTSDTAELSLVITEADDTTPIDYKDNNPFMINCSFNENGEMSASAGVMSFFILILGQARKRKLND